MPHRLENRHPEDWARTFARIQRVAPMAQRVFGLPVQPPAVPSPTTAKAPADEPKPGFFKAHYGNPEKDEIYGVSANDYETEPEQILDEKRSAGQAIWFLGAAALLTLLAYWVQQLF